MNLILDIWFFLPVIEEFDDGIKIAFIAWFKSLAVMQHESFVLVDGKKFFVDITFSDFAMGNVLDGYLVEM